MVVHAFEHSLEETDVTNIKLCYGAHYDIQDWVQGMLLETWEDKSKRCSFCNFGNPMKNNFCGNCGRDVANSCPILTTAEILDITIEHAGHPPSPVEFLATPKRVYVCQVLSSGSGSAECKKSPINMHWKAIESVILSYMRAIGLPEMQPYLFAFAEEKANKKED